MALFPETVLDHAGGSPCTVIRIGSTGALLVVKDGKAYLSSEQDMDDLAPLNLRGAPLQYLSQHCANGATKHGVFVGQSPGLFWVSTERCSSTEERSVRLAGEMLCRIVTRGGNTIVDHRLLSADEARHGYHYMSPVFVLSSGQSSTEPGTLFNPPGRGWLTPQALIERAGSDLVLTAATPEEVAAFEDRAMTPRVTPLPPIWLALDIKEKCARERFRTEDGAVRMSRFSAPVKYAADGSRERFKEGQVKQVVIAEEDELTNE